MGAIRDWATPDNLQPEPITVEIWRDLPEEFCRQVEVVNGQAVRHATAASLCPRNPELIEGFLPRRHRSEGHAP